MIFSDCCWTDIFFYFFCFFVHLFVVCRWDFVFDASWGLHVGQMVSNCIMDQALWYSVRLVFVPEACQLVFNIWHLRRAGSLFVRFDICGCHVVEYRFGCHSVFFWCVVLADTCGELALML